MRRKEQTMNKKTYHIIAPSSMGIRLTPVNRQPVETSDQFIMRASSAETNVLSISSALGLKTKVLTRFVKDSPIARSIKNDLAKRGIEYEGSEVEKGGPWGHRHQFNIADSGYGLRAPRVTNDRAGEVGLGLSVDDFDLDRLFKDQGVKMLHVSGLIAALSQATGEFCLALVEKARAHGTTISFDLNYRASFWKNREKELRETFHKIARSTDILIGNEEDFQLALGIEGPKAGGKNIHHAIESFKDMIERVKKTYPKATMFATTLREVLSANEHLWGAIVLDGNTWTVIEPRPIPVLDRIGGGDGFVGGLLYGHLQGFEPEAKAQFAWATGALVTTVIEDYALPLDEDQVWNIYSGNARVKR
jgi:2-dehydro-3-deoxygluconokinase